MTLWYVSVFAVSISLVFTAFYFAINRVLVERHNDDLIEDIEEFQQIKRSEGIEGIKQEIRNEMRIEEEAEKSIFLLVNHDGENVFHSDMQHWEEFRVDRSLITSNKSLDEPVIQIIESETREYSSRVIYGQLDDDLFLIIGESEEGRHELLEIIQMVIAVLFILALPISSYVGWLMARKAVSGIQQVSNTAQSIEFGSLDKRVPQENLWGSEIQQLAKTFNAMLDRIRNLVFDMRELTDNVAHDLRSPLARIRAHAESSLHNTPEVCHGAFADIIDECDRLMQMINATLDLAELEAGAANIKREEIDMALLVEDACELFQPLAEQKQIHLHFENHSKCLIMGDLQTLQRMLSNLLDNAIKYTPEKGDVKVDLLCDQQTINLVVTDNGPGIERNEQSQVFERFYRCDQSRSEKGCGLGLSFARAVARAHGGDITLNSEPGKGTAFSVSLRHFSSALPLH